MKIRKKVILTAGMLLLAAGLSGCAKKEKPEDYLKAELEKVKSGKSDLFDEILQEALQEENVETFPEELHEDYADFLKEAYSHMKYKISEAKDKGKNQYRIVVTVEPLDLAKTTAVINEAYISDMKSADLVTEVKAVLSLDKHELGKVVYADKLDVSVRMDWENKTYKLNKSDFSAALSAMAANKLAPYHAVEEIFDIRQYVQACMDAQCRGEFDEYARQTGITAEEAATEREEGLWDSELDELNFSDEEKNRFKDAMKTLLASVAYEVKIPRKIEENHYTVDVQVTQNFALQKSMDDLMSAINSGEISSMENLKTSYLESLERYAKEPQTGETAVVTVNIVLGEDHLLQIAEEDYENLAGTMLPVEVTEN